MHDCSKTVLINICKWFDTKVYYIAIQLKFYMKIKELICGKVRKNEGN